MLECRVSGRGGEALRPQLVKLWLNSLADTSTVLHALKAAGRFCGGGKALTECNCRAGPCGMSAATAAARVGIDRAHDSGLNTVTPATIARCVRCTTGVDVRRFGVPSILHDPRLLGFYSPMLRVVITAVETASARRCARVARQQRGCVCSRALLLLARRRLLPLVLPFLLPPPDGIPLSRSLVALRPRCSATHAQHAKHGSSLPTGCWSRASVRHGHHDCGLAGHAGQSTAFAPPCAMEV